MMGYGAELSTLGPLEHCGGWVEWNDTVFQQNILDVVTQVWLYITLTS